ncbi:MAG: hypothetical protein WC846_02470 [Candidatus Gracilibacteria bacterium]|jgi:uncharacterized membrane protein
MKAERITSYDAFRGVLLVAMVVFHVIVNLTNLKFDQNYFYWVPAGFMLFLGVILGRFLRGKDRKTVMLGVKLMGIFLVLNIPNFIEKDYTLMQLILGDQKVFSFEILLPMSIATFVSILLWKSVKGRGAEIALGLVLVFLLTYLHAVGFYSYNLWFLIYGIIGCLIGGSLDLDALSEKMSAGAFLVVVLMAIVPVFVVGSWGITESIIILQVLALYFLTAKMFGKNRVLIVLGRQSLALYVLHIVLIKILM